MNQSSVLIPILVVALIGSEFLTVGVGIRLLYVGHPLSSIGVLMIIACVMRVVAYVLMWIVILEMVAAIQRAHRRQQESEVYAI